MKTLFFILTLAAFLFAQTETSHWKGKQISYEIPIKKNKLSQTDGFFAALSKGYKFLISDYDGDNCPFQPSCSLFFVQSVKQTNIFQGFLMFADRFTRDLNYFNRGNYPKLKNGKLYDPPGKHVL